ncbi:ATP-binding protein [Solibacillus sp. NPDC093137]|uniref:ATP-binding protein n=1 Tax=Solibacillus sp. NPDC093137 TaxID=3390678 RepID=UPI003D07981D
MENELVRYSRAGDIFHYRWAARRCLRLIHPRTSVKEIRIEGSKENKKAGEYVIDVAEYSESEIDNSENVFYYQLKHTTVRKDEPFNLSDLKDTITGFAQRYVVHLEENEFKTPVPNISFTIVTNRPVNMNFKKNIFKIANSETATGQYMKTLESYTDLSEEKLKDFCMCLKFADGEGDYNAQKYDLHVEMAQLLAGSVDSPIVENITALIRDKALPDTDGKIIREEILRYFGVTSTRDLFPAPVEFEKQIHTVVDRIQYSALQESIMNTTDPIIIHAPGGVGKTFFARQVIRSLSAGSIGIIYDCFGGGRYRNRSELRHRHRDGLIQIVNELALKDLCDPLIVQSNATEDDILRKFLERIKTAVTSLRKEHNNASLVLLIDAADNAEMAAKEFGQNCFVHELLREDVIEGIKLVALCRTERIHLLDPKSNVKQLKLEPFNEEESYSFLKAKFPVISKYDGLEFYRLTNGNPRVQSNALSVSSTAEELFNSLITIGTNVDEQIKFQLNRALSTIKDKLTINYQKQVEDICIGLATLPPFLPLKILSRVANVEESTIKSFVAEMGRPLWLIDDSVQFRDEPTETWFRETYAASKEQLKYYIEQLKPLSSEFAYVATALPSLLMQAQEYSELVDMAISDDFLPNTPIDKRNVRIYRLQYAFKAALNQKRYVDAINIALRAGEEIAGDKRQSELLNKNIDLIAPLLNEEKLQELAFRRSFCGEWNGSENIYSASLLSSIPHFKGESRSYLRAAVNWLHIYFEQQKKLREVEGRQRHNEKLQYDDIVEFVYTHLNLYGADSAVNFLLGWKPSKVTYYVSRKLFKRLIDMGDFKIAKELALEGVRSQELIIAYTHEMFEVGRIPTDELLNTCLDLLTSKRTRISISKYSDEDTTLLSLITFLESCAVRKLQTTKILRILRHYYPERAGRSIVSNYRNIDRQIYFRSVVLRNALLNKILDYDELLPQEVIGESSYRKEQDIREFKEVLGGLIPWYQIRLTTILGNVEAIFNDIEEVKKNSSASRASRWKDFDIIPFEIIEIISEIFIFSTFEDEKKARKFYENYIFESNNLMIDSHLKLVRAAFRIKGLANIKRDFEENAYQAIKIAKDVSPEEKANWYINLARSVINTNSDDAAVYFNLGVDAVSKFGDEIVERWEAVVSLANRRENTEHVSKDIAYRFMRCAELVGENVAREKYWDRNEAVKTGMRLSPVTALAVISRWRDKEIGSYEYQLLSLLNEGVSKKYISSSVAWSMNPFLNKVELIDFAVLCIEREEKKEKKQYILDSIIHELNLDGIFSDSRNKITEIANKYELKMKSVDRIIYSQRMNNPIETESLIPNSQSIDKDIENWSDLLGNIEILTSEGITQAFNLFESLPFERKNRKLFWEYILLQIEDKDATSFLYKLVSADGLDIYDIKYVFSNLPKNWCRKISVKNEWPKTLELLGKNYASVLVERDTKQYFTEKLSIDNDNIASINKGIIEGLATQADIVNASSFFGFVTLATNYISTTEATNLLTYTLERFELHINDDFSDGNWSLKLSTSDDINNSIAGFIWSAMGSPISTTRWQAVHCVRILAEAKCDNIIDELISWVQKDNVGAFGANKYHFYNLHARLYLLIALSRVALDQSHILVKYKDMFNEYALKNSSHILIQKYASQIALNLAKSYPEEYEKEEIDNLKKTGISLLPKTEVHYRREQKDSYWHANGEVNSKLSFNHGYDFTSYWFGPLGRVFGISEEQVEDLVNDVVINEWNIKSNNGYQADLRQSLWKSSRNQQNTYHSHGSYPLIDNYNFYISYHAMLIVAGKLLSKMPIIQLKDSSENEWDEWLRKHLLTRSDGYWLYDRRDPMPKLRRDWVYQSKPSNWQSDINISDFLEGLLNYEDDELWLNVGGFWQDEDNGYSESFSISSALVSVEGSQSLLNALSTSSNPYDFKIPDYKEIEMEFNQDPLILKGWIFRQYIEKGLDEFDPYAGELQYPPYEIGNAISEKLSLLVDSEKRKWRFSDEEKESVICEIWGKMSINNDESTRYGNRLKASLSFLKKLCLEFQCEIIIEIQIKRNVKEHYDMRRGESDEYKPPVNKIFIFSRDGKLRDTEKYYEFR